MADVGDAGLWARSILDSTRVSAPHLLHVEVTSAFRAAVARNVLTADSAALAMGEVLDFPTELYPFDIAADRVWEFRDTMSAYDAWYVALAELLEMPLVTLDRKLAGAKGATCEFVTPSRP